MEERYVCQDCGGISELADFGYILGMYDYICPDCGSHRLEEEES